MPKWSAKYPTKEDAGKWYVMRKLDATCKVCRVEFVEIRWDDKFNEIYLCQPCNTGIENQSYGTPLKDYRAIKLEFCPLAMPEDYRAPHNQKT